MEEGTVRLWALSAAMFFGSFASGLVPLAMNLSEVCLVYIRSCAFRCQSRLTDELVLLSLQSSMQAVTTVGAGLLVGTSLAVIIPEGVHALYAAGEDRYSARCFHRIKHMYW